MEIDDAVVKSKPKAKPKPKSMTVEEQAAFDEIYDAIQPNPKPTPKPKPKPKPKAKAGASAASGPQPVIKTGLKNTKPAVVNLLTQPSKMGFRKLEQELTANSSKMVGADIALVADLVKQHRDARGGVNTKIVKGTVVKRLQEIYKRVLYNK